MSDGASVEKPIYRKVLSSPLSATSLYFITCDEGWRESIVCTGMYDWAADWLIEVLDRRPYAESRSTRTEAESSNPPL